MSRHRVILISKALLLTRNPIDSVVARRRMRILRGNAMIFNIRFKFPAKLTLPHALVVIFNSKERESVIDSR